MSDGKDITWEIEAQLTFLPRPVYNNLCCGRSLLWMHLQ